MRLGLAVVVIGLLDVGCLPKPTVKCLIDTDCGAAGVTCETTGYCSFADPTCTDGYRYGDFSGPFANQCVGAVGMIDAGIVCPPGGNPGDLDCDGVPDGSDNCPTIANGSQGNEDGDKFGDACDPCPPVANDTPPDADGDGVADACDPNPTTPGDVIVVFEGFHSGPPGSWHNSGNWSAVGDDVTARATGGNHMSSSATLSTNGPSTGRETVSASITVLDDGGSGGGGMHGGGGGGGTIGIVDEYKNASRGSDGIACALKQGTTAQLELRDLGGTGSLGTANYEMMKSMTYLISLRHDGTSYTCTGTRGTATATTTGTSSVVSTPSGVGLRLDGTEAQAQWVMVVQSP